MSQQLALFQQKTVKMPIGCSLIYEPRGRAREYAALACNVYRGCDHGCVYCYAPSATRRSAEDFAQSGPRAGKFLDKLTREAGKFQAAGFAGRQVLLSFTCDPYQHLDVELGTTRRVIQILHAHGLGVQILTKGGSRALRDLDLFGDGDAFAATLTFGRDGDSWRDWEPNAAPPSDRIATLRQFHDVCPTWVSLEPVLDPAAALDIIRQTHEFVDLFKVGKLNYDARLPAHLRQRVQGIDWATFAREAIQLLKGLGYARIHDPDHTRLAHRGNRGFYVKDDLAAYL